MSINPTATGPNFNASLLATQSGAAGTAAKSQAPKLEDPQKIRAKNDNNSLSKSHHDADPGATHAPTGDEQLELVHLSGCKIDSGHHEDEEALKERQDENARELPEGGLRLQTPDGKTFDLSKEQVEHLQAFGEKELPDEAYEHLLGGLPPEQVEAAQNFLAAQTKQIGGAKNMGLKPLPEAAAVETATPELAVVASGEMADIRDASHDSHNAPSRITPELPAETEQMAIEGRQRLDAEALQARLDKAEKASDRAWNQIDNPETWKRAGITPEDMLGVLERSRQTALQKVQDNENHPMYGEACCLAKADQLSAWVSDKAQAYKAASKTGSLDEARALQTIAMGSNEYCTNRTEFLALSQEQQTGQETRAAS